MKPAYCIFYNAPDKQVAWHNETGMPVTYETEREAQLEILDGWQVHIEQMIAEVRDFDVPGYGDWIESVRVDEYGFVHTEAGEIFTKQEE